MRELLKIIQVIQEVSNIERKKKGFKHLGRGFSTASRLNPYHPVSYLTIIIGVIIGTLLFGIYGFWKEVGMRNPFVWD